MPNSCLGQNLLVDHHWNRCFKKLMPKSCPNLKTPWTRVCIRRMFPTWENQMFAKIRLQLRSIVRVSGVEKYLPLRSADSLRFADSFRFAALR